MDCRPGCAACCIAPSISTPVPGRDGAPASPKPAGRRCVQLDADLRCRLFGQAARPAVCASLRPDAAMCGRSSAEAMLILTRLEQLTQPA
ncbi:MAG: YkgJ family cysteine cluster protein [Rubrivivax sp.]